MANLQGGNEQNMVENEQSAPQAAPQQAINPLQ
jgi:hypothetical protein